MTPQKKTQATSTDVTTVLATAADRIVGEFEIQNLLKSLVESTMELLHGEACSVYLRDEHDPAVYRCAQGAGYAESIVDEATYRLGEGLTGWIAQKQLPVNIRSKQELEEKKKKLEWKGKYDSVQWGGDKEFRNLAAQPLTIGNETIGILKVENKDAAIGECFTEQDCVNLQAIALVFALAVRNANLQKESEQRSEAIREAIHDLADKIGGRITMQELLQEVLEATMKRFDSEVCSVFLTKLDNPSQIECVAGAGYARGIVGVAEYNIGEGFTGHIAQSRKWYNIKGKSDLQRLQKYGIWTKKFNWKQFEGTGKDQCENILGGPLLLTQDEVLGVFKVENKKNDTRYVPYTDEDLRAFQTIARVVSLAIQNARLHEQIETQLKSIAGKAAHRINNQATNYDGIELELVDECNRAVPDRDNLVGICRRVRETTKSLKRMTDEFKNYGKPLSLKSDLVDINEIIQCEIALAPAHDSIEIHETLTEHLPQIFVDSARTGEAIKELLRNAIKAIKNTAIGSGDIFVGSQLLDADSEVNGNAVLVTIEDTGPGFPEGFPIFQPFHSTDPSSTGLGLATVKELLIALGGYIHAEDSNKGGACLRLAFPVPRQSEEDHKPSPSPDSRSS